MSQAAQAECPAQTPVQAPKEPTLIMQFKMQLENYKMQREQTKTQFEQLNGAIFVCEQMISQYENELKQTVVKLAKDIVKPADSLMSTDNLGEIKDGKIDIEAKKQATQK